MPSQSLRIPFGLIAYRYAAAAFSPAAGLLLRQRMARGKEDKARLGERLGRPILARPEGTLIWLHGASVGESLAALPLLKTLLTPGRHALVTTGTVTSAQIMSDRLPEGAFHQFIPLDTPQATAAFLDHWRPDVGLFIDSDLWPNLLLGAKQRGIPLALVNARMSARSASGWRHARSAITAILSTFDGVLAQDEEGAERFRSLGAREVRMVGSLKADAAPLPADPEKLAALKAAIGTRPVFLAASTHAGEDETLLPAHDAIRRQFPQLLTIVVPRHAERGEEIAMLCGTRKTVHRSGGALPGPDTAIYVADTMGELGVFFRLAPAAFVGGSLIPHGGQNPLEPARLGCAVLAGPHTGNFTVAYDAIFTAQGCGRVEGCGEIAKLMTRILAKPDEASVMGEAAAAGAAKLGGAVARTTTFVEALLTGHART
ncbi:MAG: 3-deoxy-D-manno-octulosonic acid transferase [Alphaproteobacteria bacterium]|nr:3-deoxy-D-manno-octulosonic acid transferase [Alphaproteobacteria bacterium]